jgi:hypothetical protein
LYVLVCVVVTAFLVVCKCCGLSLEDPVACDGSSSVHRTEASANCDVRGVRVWLSTFGLARRKGTECYSACATSNESRSERYRKRAARCFYPLSIFKSTSTSNREGMGRK